ncbi:hypothetical protein BB381_02030 [Campylobacter pinnipediorum subsp. caledonicus]|uniref:N-6 DNA methylase n=1 Tax=Campylobacter pinnipediorum TaxID=1965231 RepID=UPI0009C78760|nr:N-6 DNA methylase [Campylobacter pinnipediorum]OPA72351.1 hypothetical protein BB381_02030 [Campylobacter pinnipediorum subsp. caledonicus]
MITLNNFKNFLKETGFKEISNNEFIKKYINEKIIIDFKNEKIIYPKTIKRGDDTTCNFSHNENFVVLECIDRLLSQGYNSKNIEIETKWKLGRSAKSGKADIVVRDNNLNAYMIIECKTYKEEYEKELVNMFKNGGQLFSYYQQDQSAKFLVLYTSAFDGYEIKNLYTAVEMLDDENITNTEKLYKNAKNVEEYFNVWKETYQFDKFHFGIFEENILPFQIRQNQPSIQNLQEITFGDIGGKYNEFATILRKHNISGRENAFDKLLNLFLCKIIDELENSSKLEFNYKGKRYDDIFDFCDRLQKLYQKGMSKFLNRDITYVSQKEIDEAFKFVKDSPDETKRVIGEYFKKLKFFTNNDFAFIEVYNEELFRKNIKILIEIVQMFENIRLTSSTHNQFLGDLFEGFLDQGVKQSEGQFFTPLPIVKFMISSLPLDKILDSKENVFVIDYACGAGHFLNEYANFIKTHYIKDKDILKKHYKNIFGIEKESRLSKVSKVASFMYGQDINIIDHDALAYNEQIDNQKFDILIANPPYSVKGFLTTLKDDENFNNYELTSLVENLETSNSIECFFIERAAQILQTESLASIIVPSSLINKSGKIYEKTREILLKNFEILAISEFGNKTFGKTGTNTVVLFLQKLSNNPNIYQHSKNRANDIIYQNNFLQEYKDKNNLKEFCEFLRYDFNDYLDFIKNGKILNNEIFDEYKKSFEASSEYKNLQKKKITLKYKELDKDNEIKKALLSYIKDIECDKFGIFQTIKHQKTIIIQAPSGNEEQKKFLGYDWSSAKGQEGIKYISKQPLKNEDSEILQNINGLDNIDSVLYDPMDFNNHEKLNFLIRQHIAKNNVQIPENLKTFTKLVNLKDCIDFTKPFFNKSISLSANNSIEIISKFPLVKLENIIEKLETGSRPKGGVGILDKGILSLGGEHIHNTYGRVNLSNLKFVDEEYYNKNNQGKIEKNDILICKDGALTGKIAIIGDELNNKKAMINEHVFLVRNSNLNIQKYIFYFLYSPLGQQLLKSNITGSTQGGINYKNLKNIKIPRPSIDIQKQIVEECEKVSNEFKTIRMEIKEYKEKMNKIFDKFGIQTNGGGDELISKYCDILIGGTPKRDNSSYYNGSNLWLSISEMNSNVITDTKEKISDLGVKNSNVKLIPKDTTLVSFKLSIGKTAIAGKDLYTNEAIAGFVVKDEYKNNILNKFIFCLFECNIIKLKKDSLNAFGKSLNSKDLNNIKIPKLPSKNIQKQIIQEFEKYEKEISQRKIKLEKEQGLYKEILDNYLN